MGSSPYGTSPMSSFTPGCSPPVGSAPKSFPHFQHPSHALLEANGFKQQKYVSITCISSIGSMAYQESWLACCCFCVWISALIGTIWDLWTILFSCIWILPDWFLGYLDLTHRFDHWHELHVDCWPILGGCRYARYFKRCLTERKHLGIGCSEVRLHSVLCCSFKVIMSCSVEVSLLSKGTS